MAFGRPFIRVANTQKQRKRKSQGSVSTWTHPVYFSGMGGQGQERGSVGIILPESPTLQRVVMPEPSPQIERVTFPRFPAPRPTPTPPPRVVVEGIEVDAKEKDVGNSGGTLLGLSVGPRVLPQNPSFRVAEPSVLFSGIAVEPTVCEPIRIVYPTYVYGPYVGARHCDVYSGYARLPLGRIRGTEVLPTTKRAKSIPVVPHSGTRIAPAVCPPTAVPSSPLPTPVSVSGTNIGPRVCEPFVSPLSVGGVRVLNTPADTDKGQSVRFGAIEGAPIVPTVCLPSRPVVRTGPAVFGTYVPPIHCHPPPYAAPNIVEGVVVPAKRKVSVSLPMTGLVPGTKILPT